MSMDNMEGLLRVVQASISPIALVSGVGLILLSLTNRFARVTDRLRELARERRSGELSAADAELQIAVFRRRARILRYSISAAVLSVLGASMIVLLIFAMAVADLSLTWTVLALFALSLIALITSLVLFLRDMQLSLDAVKHELDSGNAT